MTSQAIAFYEVQTNIHKDLLHLKSVLEQESQILISWFVQNLMKANPDKLQAICIGKKTHDNIESFQIGLTNINTFLTISYHPRDLL